MRNPMLILKIITYLSAFCAAIGQFVLNYVVSNRESLIYKRTRIGLFIMLALSLSASIVLLVKEDMKSIDLSRQVVELKALIVSKDNNSIGREQKAQADRDKLLIELNSLNNKMEPFIVLARTKYPRADIDNALKNLLKEFNELKAIAGPNILRYQDYSVKKEGNNYVVKIRFRPEKNIPLGLISIVVGVPDKSGSKILNIWPNTDGGAFQTGKDSKVIAANGEAARIAYSLLGAGVPTIDVTITRLVPLKILGNNGLNEFILRPEIN
jgi:hypothetical protein